LEEKMKVLITGVYGFIGYSVAKKLLSQGIEVVGIDKITDAISHKEGRIKDLSQTKGFTFYDINLSNWDAVHRILKAHDFDRVLHLAGQYSVLHTTEHVRSYIEGNLVGFTQLMELSALNGIKRFVYASSTFVEDGKQSPAMYGATKQFNEDCAFVYSSNKNIAMETVGLRFGSTYGSHVRPDTGIFQVANKLLRDQPIVLQGGFGYKTAFVYIDDAVECCIQALQVRLKDQYNVLTVVADDRTWNLGEILEMMEMCTGKNAIRKGSVYDHSEPFTPKEKVDQLQSVLGYRPQMDMTNGVIRFMDWFRKYYKL
jgi:UDP-glucuronate 4-epimerase